MNVELKVELIRHFGTQVAAAKQLKISGPKLSYLVRGHAEPSARERQILCAALGADYFPATLGDEQRAGAANDQ